MTYIEFKKGAKHAEKGADISDDINAFSDCGYFLKKDDIVIDIDHTSKEFIENMIDYFDIKTQTVWTDRGAHIYFKKPLGFGRARNGVCALGIEIEMKNSSNTPRGLTIKRNGVQRDIENLGQHQELPWFLVGSSKFKSLYGMGEGDGRNNALYAHKMKLGNHEGWEQVLSFINEYVFDEPLTDKEFSTASRSEKINTKEQSQYQVAERILNEYRCVKYMNYLWWYDPKEKDYVYDAKNDRFKRLVYNVCGEVTSNYVDEVIKQITYRAKTYSQDTAFPIKFTNGILSPDGYWVEKDDGEYDGFTPYSIDITYKPDVKPVEIVDEYLKNLTNNDEEYRKALLEALAFVLVTDPERIRALGKFFIFRGDGRNGKGTLLQIMARIYNRKNCTNLSIKQLSDPRYNITMIGKLANLGDDIEGDAIDNAQMKMLKNIATADGVTSRKLYEQSESVTFTTKLYFTTNADVKSYEKGYAYQRRVVWMPMFNKVEKPDPRFITKITTKAALEYWVSLIMQGYNRLISNEEWSRSEALEKFNSEYHEANNPMNRFVKDLGDDLENVFLNRTVNEIRLTFDDWADDDGLKFSAKLLKIALWDNFKVGLGVKKVSGKSKRVFLRQSDCTQDLTPK